VKVHAGEQSHSMHTSKHCSDIVITLVVPFVAAPAGRAVPLHIEDVGVKRPVAFGERSELVGGVGLGRA
jgi:hypothetical protein